jgi:hypothetical protein
MSENGTTTTAKTPWHIWVVGVIALLWNAMGAFDYLMTETQNEGYMAKFTPEQLDFFYGFPAWMVAFWAVAVWGGVLGAVLLLLKKKLAAPVFLVSFLCMAVTAVRNFGFADGMEVMGTGGATFSAVIFVFALFLVVYSRAMKNGGVLR